MEQRLGMGRTHAAGLLVQVILQNVLHYGGRVPLAAEGDERCMGFPLRTGSRIMMGKWVGQQFR